MRTRFMDFRKHVVNIRMEDEDFILEDFLLAKQLLDDLPLDTK